jgi:hypothetical protein
MVSQEEKNQRHVDNIKKVGQDKEKVSNRSPACPKVLSMSMGVDPFAPPIAFASSCLVINDVLFS